MAWHLVTLALAMAVCVLVYWKRVDIHAAVVARRAPDIIFLGDSITAVGRVWDWRLGRASFRTANYGQSSAGIRVVSWVARVLALPATHATQVSIMAGTNDVPSMAGYLGFQGDVDGAAREYADLLQYLAASGVQRIVVTSAPPQVDAVNNAFLDRLNAALRLEVARLPGAEYIDLWPQLADGGRIRPEMTTDGVHFSAKAYRIWARELAKRLR
jgi:lysophospholipase L1-like esterase